MSDAYSNWAAEVAQLGGNRGTWPFSDGNYGAVAAFWSPAAYAALVGTTTNEGFTFPALAALPMPGVQQLPTVSSNPLAQGGAVFVLASAMVGSSAVDDAYSSDLSTGTASANPDPSSACGGIMGTLGLCDLGANIEGAVPWVLGGIAALLLLEKAL